MIPCTCPSHLAHLPMHGRVVQPTLQTHLTTLIYDHPLSDAQSTWQPFHLDAPSTSWDTIYPPGNFDISYIPELAFPPSPSDTCSSLSADISPSLRPEPPHVVCNAPLVAPIPLPYHSPTFLQFDLPDIDEDLSHPPYIRRPAKRKYDGDGDGRIASKSHASDNRSSATSQRHPGSSNRSHHHFGVKRRRSPRHNFC